MWVSKRFDIGWADFAVAAYRCVVSGSEDVATEAVEDLWGGSDDALACLSVRSAFDLLLETLALPAGDDVVFSALTVSAMPQIAARHRLNPVPCDLDLETGAPGLDQLKAACTPKTRVVVLAHLFGSRMDLGPLAAWARDRGILVVEDCAQAYSGRGYRGHDAADLSLFSFGPIKHATALGGAMATVRDPGLLGRMREVHRRWPAQPRLEYFRRVIKYSLLHVLATRPVYTPFAWSVRALGKDLDTLVNRMTRGFSGAAMFRQIRRRPSVPLLGMLARRLRQDVDRFRRNEARAREVLGAAAGRLLSPGVGVSPHSFWLLPILSEDPPRAMETLRRRGFDATLGRSFAVVGADTASAPVAERIHRHAVYVPFYPPMPDRVVRRLAVALTEVAANGAGPPAATGPTSTSP